MRFISLNGNIISSDKLILPAHSRLRFGDGFFESMRFFNGRVAFVGAHFNRIVASCLVLQMNLPENFDENFFNQSVCLLAEANEVAFARVRVQFWRKGGGRYAPSENGTDFLIELEDDGVKSYSENFIEHVACSLNHQKHFSLFSSLKSSNALIYVLGSIEAKQRGMDELILLNHEGNVCEALSSNVFVEDEHGNFFTPPLSSGCVDGVMRNVVLQLIEATEKTITLQELRNSKCVLLTNASKGISVVKSFETVSLHGSTSVKPLIEALNRLVL